MAKKYWIPLGVAAVVVVLVIGNFAAGHQTPSGTTAVPGDYSAIAP